MPGWWLLGVVASAGELFSVSGEVGGTARYLDNAVLASPAGGGLNVGARLEVDVKFQTRLDVRYVEGRAFSSTQPRYVDLSGALSTPALLTLCLDLHEVFYRATFTEGDGLFYANGGLGFKGRIAGSTLKGSLGVSYLQAPDPLAPQDALGGYVGIDLLVRTKWVDANTRGAVFGAFQDARLYGGLLLDGDLVVKIPAGRAWVGPRLDVTYRNLGLNPDAGRLFGAQHELVGHVAFAVGWGTGPRKR